MFTIRKATSDDCKLINELANQVFPATYKEILSTEQLDYMMEWMYAPADRLIRKSCCRRTWLKFRCRRSS